MTKVDFSVIIPVYNSSKTLERLCGQILNNDLNLELILVNDGSPDNSLEVCNLIAKRDKRVIVIDQKNAGPSAARNTGIEKSKGEFIIFCDSDDEIDSKSFETIANRAKENLSDMLVCGWVIKQQLKNQQITRKVNLKDQSILHPDIISKTIKSIAEDGRMYNLWNKIYRAEVIRKNNLQLRKDLKFGEDLLFNFEFLKHAKKINFVSNSPYYIYEEDSPTSTVSSTKLNYEFREKNLEALDKFCSESNSRSNREMANFVKWRWLVSYCLAICKSKQKLTEKIK